MRFWGFLLAVAGCVFAQEPVNRRHLIDHTKALTAPSSQPAAAIARDFLAAQASAMGLNTAALDGVYVAKQYTDVHNGVTHIVYRQRFRGVDVVNAAYAVNLDSSGQVLNAGGSLATAPEAAAPTLAGMTVAVRAAVAAVNPKAAAGYNAVPSMKRPLRNGAVRFAEVELSPESAPEGRMVWFRGAGGLVPAYEVYALAEDGITSYRVLVDSQGTLLRQMPMTFFQRAKGLVFERESPQPNPKPGVLMTEAPPIVERTSQSFDGDPTASPAGWVTNNETRGNNAVVGQNLLGIRFSKDIVPTRTTENDFSFPLWIGPGAASPLNYPDAVNTNLFYWVNRAHDLFYAAGFNEAAGNFQFDNFGRGGTGDDGVWAYTHFGAAGRGVSSIDNAFFSWRDASDGSQPMIAMFVASGGNQVTDGSLDSAIIVHEYTHGVTNRLLPDGYDSFQVAAMGEACSDFYALEFLTPQGADPNGVYTTSQYFFQSWAQDSVRSRPYSTDMKQNPLTFASMGNVIGFQEVHADGEIWTLALWEVRANLIRQFGETEGRKRVRQLVLDGIKLAPPRSTMVDMRDAILLADRVSFKGESQQQIWEAFAKRGLGALAFSTDADSAHVQASTAMPSPKGSIAFLDSPVTAGDVAQVVLQDSNQTQPSVNVTMYTDAGDLETVTLRREGSVYYGSLPTSLNPTSVNRNNGFANSKVGGYVNVYYDDPDTGSGPGQISTALQVNKTYSASLANVNYPTFARTTRLNPGTFASLITLPFEFPFFGSRYRTAYVHRNGLITFGSVPAQAEVTFGCTDRPSLAKMPAIAALWSNLSITGSAQPNEGVWRSSQDDGSVVIQWVAETVNSYRAEPVNVAVRLFHDGVIQIHYGSGNAEIGAATTPLGCGQTPVIGMSPGYGTTGFTYSLPSPLANAQLTFEPPFSASSAPRLTVESPEAGETVRGALTVRGILYDESAGVYAVESMVDGVKQAMVTTRVARPDYCSAQNVPGCPAVGYTMDVDVSGLAPGEHKLVVRASNVRQGITESAPISFTIGEGAGRVPVIRIESPTADQIVKGALRVTGYAYAADLRITAIDTLIDGITYGPTQYGMPRTDVCGALPAPAPVNCPAIGFVAQINPASAAPPLANGPHTLQVRIQDSTGRYTLYPETPMLFHVEYAQATTGGAITSIRPGETLRGQVEIAGYVYSSAARGILGASIVVDGLYSWGSARVGLPAEEVCAGLGGVASCPNIGFSGMLDTRLLSNGPHTIAVAATDGDGRQIYLPLPGSPVMSIVVDNR